MVSPPYATSPSVPVPEVWLRVFGGLRAEQRAGTGVPLDLGLGGRQERTLLALLVVHRGQPLSGERLVDLLWPDEPPPSAAKIVQVYVGRLRSTFGHEAVVRTGDAYRLTGAVGVVSDRFESLVSAGLAAVATDPLVALGHLDRALGEAVGEPYATEADLHELRAAARRLVELRWQAQEARIDLLLRLGRTPEVLAAFPALVAADPFRESLRLAGMRALAIAGRRAEALASFEDAAACLRDQLGVEPDTALVELRGQIARGERIVLQQIDRPFGLALPAQTSPFIGRDAELDDLCERLRPGGSRLVTITGTGGSGKTRLALETGTRLATAFNDAVAFVDLAGARGGSDVWPTIRSVLGIAGHDGRALAGARCLLILDNPERVTDIGAALAALLREAPRAQLLVASRVMVRVHGEEMWAVEPLAADDAAALFAARVVAAGATPQPRVVVDSICERVDRLPLAIEIAALRVRALTGPELLQALAHRIPVLVDGADDGTARHRTIEATIAWGYDLLAPQARVMFTRLAVFKGGWTVPAAMAVCNATHEELADLVDHNLIRRVGSRMAMLDTIHEFALARLEQEPDRAALLERHADWFLAEARRQEAEGPPELQYRLLEDDVQNERQAMATLCAGPVTDRALELADLMWMTWVGQGRFAEGDEWYTAAVARLSTGDPPPWSLVAWAELPRVMGDLDRSEQLKLEALRRMRLDGPTGRLAATLTDLGEIARVRGDLRLARARAEEAVAIRRSIGDPGGIVHALMGLSDVDVDEGRLTVAETLLDEGMAYLRSIARISREAGHFAAYLPLSLARARMLRGAFDGTGELIAEGLDAANQLRLRDAVAQGLRLAAGWLGTMGDPTHAALVAGAGNAFQDRYGLPGGLLRDAGDPVPLLVATLGRARAEALMADGAMLGEGAATRLALDTLRHHGQGAT